MTQMSAGGMALLAPVKCEEGERIVAYLDHIGRVEGIVARSVEGGFAVRILASASRRERIVNLLTWLINQESLGLSEERKHERVVPRISASKLILPNGDGHIAVCSTFRFVKRRFNRVCRQAADRHRGGSWAYAGPRRPRSRSGRGNKVRRASRSPQYCAFLRLRASAAFAS